MAAKQATATPIPSWSKLQLEIFFCMVGTIFAKNLDGNGPLMRNSSQRLRAVLTDQDTYSFTALNGFRYLDELLVVHPVYVSKSANCVPCLEAGVFGWAASHDAVNFGEWRFYNA